MNRPVVGHAGTQEPTGPTLPVFPNPDPTLIDEETASRAANSELLMSYFVIKSRLKLILPAHTFVWPSTLILLDFL